MVSGQDMTPLPPPPPPEAPKNLNRGPWRGPGWFGGRLELIVPIGGQQPAVGKNVVTSGAGALELGWRIRNFVGLHTGLSLAVHDGLVSRTDEFGNSGVVYGYLLGLELLGIRGYLPVTGRFQPYLDATGGLGLWYPAGTDRTEVGGLARFALGFDGWVNPNFTLGLDTAYRMYALDDSTGHFLSVGAHLALHW